MSVKLRMKYLAGGKKGLYLDIYHSGQRHYDFLKLYLEKGTSNRIVAAHRETLELATQTNLTAAETGKVELSCIFTEKKNRNGMRQPASRHRTDTK